MTNRKCSICGQVKNIDEFYKKRGYPDKRCKQCVLARMKRFQAMPLEDLLDGENKNLILKRFWKHVDVKNKNDCWEWKSKKDKDGYGNMQFKNKTVRANRFIWTVLNGAIPEGMVVCHKCDNPKCLNPDHLFLGTISDNVIDALKKNRLSNQKLTVDQVKELRKLYKTGKYSQSELGRIFGVSGSTVCQIVHRKLWKFIN